jgi:hypothetical protein
MAYLFIDESGDLGFSKRSSKWFVFTIILTKNHRPLEKVIKKVRNTLKKKHKSITELHAYHVDDVTRKRVLQHLAEVSDLQVLCVVLNKEKVYVDLQNQKNYLYNYVANILLDRLHQKDILPQDEHLDICFDRKDTKKNLRSNFTQYLETALKGKRNGNVSISLEASHNVKALQAVDFVSWAIFRKYEKGDYEYYELIKDKIVEENLLFP